MKTKNKFFLFAATFIFFGVFLVRVNSVRASDYYDCMNDTSTSAADCDGLEGDPVMPTGGETIIDTVAPNPTINDTSLDEYDCDGTPCTSEEFNSYYSDYDIVDENNALLNNVTQADCTSFGVGYIVSDDGMSCELPGNSDYAACMAVENDVAFCSRADSSLCSTNAECITDYGAGFVCDQTTRTCEERGADVTVTTGSGDVCYTDSECNWYSKCKLGTNGATGICQGYLNFSDPQNTLNALGLPNGSTISPSGVVTAPNGTITQLTPAQIVQVQAVNGVTSGNTNVNYTPAGPKCGTGFRDVGGVCFPTNTGLSSASISDILMSLFGWLMGLFTTFAVLAFVISGIQYFMASGDESMAEKAKENATHAVIGIIIGLSGFIIVKAIAAALSGTSVIF